MMLWFQGRPAGILAGEENSCYNTKVCVYLEQGHTDVYYPAYCICLSFTLLSPELEVLLLSLSVGMIA